MQANFLIATQEAVFEAGTVGGDWAWSLSETDTLPGRTTKEAVVWTTVEPFTSREVEPGTTYRVTGVRIDPEKAQLGPSVSSVFTTEEVPPEVVINVAASMNVELS